MRNTPVSHINDWHYLWNRNLSRFNDRQDSFRCKKFFMRGCDLYFRQPKERTEKYNDLLDRQTRRRLVAGTSQWYIVRLMKVNAGGIVIPLQDHEEEHNSMLCHKDNSFQADEFCWTLFLKFTVSTACVLKMMHQLFKINANMITMSGRIECVMKILL